MSAFQGRPASRRCPRRGRISSTNASNLHTSMCNMLHCTVVSVSARCPENTRFKFQMSGHTILYTCIGCSEAINRTYTDVQPSFAGSFTAVAHICPSKHNQYRVADVQCSAVQYQWTWPQICSPYSFETKIKKSLIRSCLFHEFLTCCAS